MKRMIYLSLALIIATPSIVWAEVKGEVNLGARVTHFASDDESAKFGEYRDLSDGLFGSFDLSYSTDEAYLDLFFENPSLDDQSYEVTGGRYGKYKIRAYYDELNHFLSLAPDVRTPAIGIGSNYLIIPDADIAASVPPVSAWTPFDYEITRKVYGLEFTHTPDNPFYYEVSVEQQKHDGVQPWGLVNTSDFVLPLAVDYTTNNITAEGGYRSEGTAVVFYGGFSQFDNDNDIFSTFDGTELQEYSTPADNYSYNFAGRLKQKLPMNSLLALKISYTSRVSEADFSEYQTITSPSADNDFDGEVNYFRANAAVSSMWTDAIDTRLYYNYTDRDNDSEELTTLAGAEIRTNHLYEYTTNQVGIDFNYRINTSNKLNSGYEYTYTDRNREDAESQRDNLLFAQLKNDTTDWMDTKIRLEYLNRSSDSEYSAESLSGDGLIRQYFTPFDYASKDRYKGKISFEFYPATGLDFGLSYAFVYDDFDATIYGVQDDQRHEFYLDAGLMVMKDARLSAYAGYEYTESSYQARAYRFASPAPGTPEGSDDYFWTQDTTYDYFVVGASLNVPVTKQLEIIISANYQMVDGNIDFSRSAAAGAPLETIDNADDYYKTEFDLKTKYQLNDALGFTLGYLFETSNLYEWKYDNYTYTPGSDYYSGAGLDNNYEAHQVYLITTYSF